MKTSQSQMIGTCGGQVIYGFPFDNYGVSKKQKDQWVKEQKGVLERINQPYVFATINCQQTQIEPCLLELGFKQVSEGWRFNYEHKVKVFLWENPRSPAREAEFEKNAKAAEERCQELYRQAEEAAKKAAETRKTVRVNPYRNIQVIYTDNPGTGF